MQRHPHFTLEQMMVYLNIPTTARIQALGLALLDFSGAEDLAAWLGAHAG